MRPGDEVGQDKIDGYVSGAEGATAEDDKQGSEAMTETRTGGGASVGRDVETGGDLTGRDRMASSIHFSNQDNAMIWREIIALGDKITEVRIRLDDLPARVGVLEVRLQVQPVTTSNLSMRGLYWIIGVGLFVIASMMATQIILQVTR